MHHREQFGHGVKGIGRAPAADRVGMKVLWCSDRVVGDTRWGVVPSLRLNIPLYYYGI
jgi:hypothetical protein